MSAVRPMTLESLGYAPGKPSPPRWLETKEVAEQLGVSAGAIRNPKTDVRRVVRHIPEAGWCPEDVAFVRSVMTETGLPVRYAIRVCAALREGRIGFSASPSSPSLLGEQG